MVIEIFSTKSQPYGLLSNNAVVPMTINGERWSSVTEYVYVNLFQPGAEREKMRGAYHKNPFDVAIALRNSEDEFTYLDALIYGTRARFSQDKQLMEKLKDLGDRPIKVVSGNDDESRRLFALFNQLRFDPHHSFFDDKYGQVPFNEVNAVVVGVANALISNPDLPDEPFSQLVKYAARNAPPRRDLVSALATLDEIVPVLKIKLRNEIYAKQVQRFQTHLLNVTLDYILETKYPNIAPDQFHLAKRQQIVKEPNLLRYMHNLYNLYRSDNLPLAIQRKLEWEPTIPAGPEVTVDRIEETETATFASGLAEYVADPTTFKLPELMEPPALVNEIVITANHEFLPSYPGSVRIRDRTYRSVVAFAYSVLLARIGAKGIDVNALDLTQLVREYGLLKNAHIADMLTENNAVAMDAKFTSNDSLKALLLSTGAAKLIWADRSDQVLGGMPNRAGAYLEFLRNKLTEPTGVVVTHPLDNIVLASWFVSRAEDYANTLKLFDVKSTQSLEIVYGRRAANTDVDVISTSAADAMNSGGLNKGDQKIVLPMIASEFAALIAESNDLKDVVRAFVNSYDTERPTAAERQAAEENLGAAFDIVKPYLRPTVGRLAFIAIILSNQPVFNLKQEQWWRVNNWSHATPVAPSMQKLYFLTGKQSASLFLRFCEENSIDPKRTVVIFPGNVGHHTANTTLYSKKSGSGLAAFTGSLAAIKVPTLSLPTVGVAADTVTDVSVGAVADLWRALGYGLNLALPMRPYSNMYFPRPFAHTNPPMEPSFWGAVATTPNPTLASYYQDQLESIVKFLETKTDIPTRFVSAYRDGQNAQQHPTAWYISTS